METRVVAASENEATPVCIAAMRALTFLHNCGISQKRPLEIDLVQRVTHPFGGKAIATFDKSRGRIEILSTEMMQKLLRKDSTYSRMPVADVFDSIVTHEVTHAIWAGHLGERRLPHAAHEYAAYAVQIATMPEMRRERFLSSFADNRGGDDLSAFNEGYLALAPLAFGAAAYRHMTRTSRPCEVLGAIATGKLRFPKASE